MSDRFLVVLPADPQAELPATAGAVRGALSELAGTLEARVKDYGKLQFIDAGTLANRVTCPACAHVLSDKDWQEWMDQDWHGEDGFHLHRRAAPCCGADLTLNDLVYDAPQGFARWFISARAQDRGPLSADELSQLERLAGLPLVAIAQQY